MSTRYTAEDHRKAFETWYETRNMAEVASSLGANYLTPRRWRDADFNCSWSCPYHDWDKLMDERDAALHARAQLVNGGNVDPIAHEKAMREAINNPDAPRSVVVNNCVRSDLERLAHWEYLYSKVYFDMTGIALDYGSIKEEEARAQYRAGLHVTNAESGVRMMKVIQQQIDGLQGAERVRPEISAKQEKAEQLTLQQLRQMRHLAQSTPPEKLKTMLTVMDAEDAKPTTAAS